MKIDAKEYARIAEMISSPDSPVGIDATKTHVYIIHLLQKIERRLKQLDDRMSKLEEASHLKF